MEDIEIKRGTLGIKLKTPRPSREHESTEAGMPKPKQDDAETKSRECRVTKPKIWTSVMTKKSVFIDC